ncbi:hypothetical protein PTSG_08647 [Salpingoeca rosetta]|uniref:Inward rectifier potassium channel C-terminal domain-containing protein n=1 Tax=Salpingoeca rosetta (strain ATCC 50818 / BSB-021) TaxID=946362 RepID=F2UKA0_SALR5|nr:uncharacterized protein PTSG_08647 [Salpingoeca rosetta]EGD77549.1 hypothetical protein PTSG_08647 [Salpingoeca rosetta]|eukprot:XP_004990437.1 hypothetical protein PTSG_08647 [Salpingoeca rosetta]
MGDSQDLHHTPSLHASDAVPTAEAPVQGKPPPLLQQHLQPPQSAVPGLFDADTVDAPMSASSEERARTTLFNTIANANISPPPSSSALASSDFEAPDSEQLTPLSPLSPPETTTAAATPAEVTTAEQPKATPSTAHAAQQNGSGILKARGSPSPPRRRNASNVSFSLKPTLVTDTSPTAAHSTSHSSSSSSSSPSSATPPAQRPGSQSPPSPPSPPSPSHDEASSASHDGRWANMRARFSPWNRLLFALGRQPAVRPQESLEDDEYEYGDDYDDEDGDEESGGDSQGGDSAGSDGALGTSYGNDVQLCPHTQQHTVDLKNQNLKRRRRRSRMNMLPKHTVGLDWMQVMRTRTQLLNQQFSANMNLVFVALESSWVYLALFYFAGVFLAATILAALFYACECRESLDFGRVLLLVAQQIMTGPAFIESGDIATPDLSHGCIILGFLSSTTTIIFQAFLLSMAVRKLMKPRTAITFTRKLVVNTRDGVPCLQARILNLRGNLISDVQVNATRSRRVRTREGENYYKIEKLKFEGPHMMKFPGIFTHRIDESSPLYEEFSKKSFVGGFVWVEFTGYDHVLTEQVHQLWLFELPGDVMPCSRFADMVVKGTTEAITDGTYRMIINMANFNKIVRLHSNSQCCKLCRTGCPFGSQAQRRATLGERDAGALSRGTPRNEEAAPDEKKH